jgi:hypothetical protein
MFISTARYEVRFELYDEVHSATPDLEEAKRIANHLSNWNHATQVVDAETKQVMYRAAPWSRIFWRG